MNNCESEYNKGKPHCFDRSRNSERLGCVYCDQKAIECPNCGAIMLVDDFTKVYPETACLDCAQIKSANPELFEWVLKVAKYQAMNAVRGLTVSLRND
jgi:hypothetical protein